MSNAMQNNVKKNINTLRPQSCQKTASYFAARYMTPLLFHIVWAIHPFPRSVIWSHLRTVYPHPSTMLILALAALALWFVMLLRWRRFFFELWPNVVLWQPISPILTHHHSQATYAVSDLLIDNMASITSWFITLRAIKDIFPTHASWSTTGAAAPTDWVQDVFIRCVASHDDGWCLVVLKWVWVQAKDVFKGLCELRLGCLISLAVMQNRFIVARSHYIPPFTPRLQDGIRGYVRRVAVSRLAQGRVFISNKAESDIGNTPYWRTNSYEGALVRSVGVKHSPQTPLIWAIGHKQSICGRRTNSIHLISTLARLPAARTRANWGRISYSNKSYILKSRRNRIMISDDDSLTSEAVSRACTAGN